jgi:hypothetical protein
MGGLSDSRSITGRFQRAALEVLREHERHGELPTSARFIVYELVSRGVIDKRADRGPKSGRHLWHAIKHLRDVGDVPWEWIVDETRTLYKFGYGPTIAEHLATRLLGTRLDLWDGQAPPLVVTESRSLTGVLSNTAADYLVPLASTSGQCGGFLVTDLVPLLHHSERRVLYLGDWDWQGQQIETNTRRVLERHVSRPIAWERLAITAEQIDQHGLRDRVITKVDSRYRPPRAHDAIETEALRQRVIVDLVRSRLDDLLPEPRERVLERERRERSELDAYLRRRES